ncbi:hypothetical protein MKX08_007321 [Trichoderma sp. CBMAI-0020]|nr:hypothetical protein MKX08_007321 [Trichoderma sp. CBMAI-0020]
MFRASPLLRVPGGMLGAKLASPRPLSITQRRPLYNTVRLSSSSNDPPKPPPKKLESSEHVSTTSSVRSVFEPDEGTKKDAVEVNSGLKHDIGMVKETFRLDTVPRESHILGLSGTIPYLATSLSTVFLAWNLNKDVPSGNRILDHILLEHDTAKYLLDFIEPLQLGYGAVIISFLGAIHWGLEYAEKKPQHDRTRFRYGMGLGASILAWPTLMMPLEYALTTQFGAFVALYYADSRATKRGWAPPWYGKYRFLLTAMVGLAIFVSLVGRAKISQRGELNQKSTKARIEDPGLADKDTDWAKLEREEMEKIKKEKAKKAREEGQAEKKKKQEDMKGKPGKNGDDVKDKQKDEKDDGEDDQEKDGDKDEKEDDKDQQDDKDDGDEKHEGDEKEKKDDGKDDAKDQSEDKSEDKGKDKGEDKNDDADNSQQDEAKDDNKSKDDNSKDMSDKDGKSAKGDKDSKKKK